MAMLQLHCSLVCSKMDYGSFVYGSAVTSNLSIIYPVHHTGICLAAGAFWTSYLVSLYTESGEPALSLWSNLLLCGYAAKLAPSPCTWCSISTHYLRQF